MGLRLWAADPVWQYDARIDLGGGEFMRADFLHPVHRRIIEVESSGEESKWTLRRCLGLRMAGYKVRVITNPTQVEEVARD